jgi:hypothetical protein
MKRTIAIVAGLAIAGAAFAQVDTKRPMVTGRGNVNGHPGKVIVTNQTDPKADEAIQLEKFVVTGSLLPHGKQPAPQAPHRK